MAGISKQLSSHCKTPLVMSLKDVRNQLLISHDDGVINDEELLLLYDLNRSDNLDLPYNSYPGIAQMINLAVVNLFLILFIFSINMLC